MILNRLLGRKTRDIEAVYSAIVTAARQRHFYAEWGVPDTVDGRFDMIVLHLFLVLERLRMEKVHEEVSQDLTDYFFQDMDRSLREMGVGDLSVGKKVRKMAEACYGRMMAYSNAIASDDGELEQVVARNVYAGSLHDENVAKLTAWIRKAHALLREQSAERIVTGVVQWS
jgi:cytochrome b pre-mRNA-processing protein 3